ncbi:hypothetical protein [Streptomyces sp. NPDC006285]|uniref:hypothetical protein n=1 Tax=Streptomyces sp. NPDC006285 TaxID=3364742 RepID=UPI00369CEA5B
MTTPLYVFPDAELVAVTVLRQALAAGTHVGTEWPDGLLGKLTDGVVSVSRGSGAVITRNVLEDVTLDIDILAADKGRALDLAQLVRAHLRAAEGTSVDGAQIYTVADLSLIWLPYEPGPETDPVPRYVLVLQMRLRARPASQ